MEVVGGVLLLFFVIYEWKIAPKPVVTRRIFANPTFLMAVVIDFCFYLSGYLRDVYYLYHVQVQKDITLTEWGYFGNTSTVVLSLTGMLVGFIIRKTHRYKYMQIFGIGVRILGLGLSIYACDGIPSWSLLIFSQSKSNEAWTDSRLIFDVLQ